MNIKTICLAIRVVKNTISDTRSKVTGQRPGTGGIGVSWEAKGSRAAAFSRPRGLGSSPALWAEAGLAGNTLRRKTEKGWRE